jgi:hypothetical protein
MNNMENGNKNFQLTSIYYLRLPFVFGADFQQFVRPVPSLQPTVSIAPLHEQTDKRVVEMGWEKASGAECDKNEEIMKIIYNQKFLYGKVFTKLSFMLRLQCFRC